MNTTSHKQAIKQSLKKVWPVVALLLVMIVTRSGIVDHIQDASWAVFFLVGFYLRNYIGFPLFLVSAMAIDFAMIVTRGDPQDFYVTASYLFLIPAYGALWFAGNWFAKHYSENLKGLMLFIASAVAGIIVCDLISSGGFYWTSKPIAQLSMDEFLFSMTTFLPMYLQSTMLYLSIAAITHIAFVQARKFSTQQTHTS